MAQIRPQFYCKVYFRSEAEMIDMQSRAKMLGKSLSGHLRDLGYIDLHTAGLRSHNPFNFGEKQENEQPPQSRPVVLPPGLTQQMIDESAARLREPTPEEIEAERQAIRDGLKEDGEVGLKPDNFKPPVKPGEDDFDLATPEQEQKHEEVAKEKEQHFDPGLFE